MAKIFVRSAYNYDVEAVSNETGLKCEDESKAQQNQKEESDINTIVRRFGLTGQLPDNIRIPQYGDFTGIKDYQSALNQVKEAQENFMMLPADIRSRFKNDPQEFMEFCLNPENGKELVEMGLAVKNPTLEAVTETVVPSPAAPPKAP